MTEEKEPEDDLQRDTEEEEEEEEEEEQNDDQELEERSGTEKHWDQFCLSMITVATAAFAAVLLVSGLTNIDEGEKTTLDATRAALTGIAAGVYAGLVITAGRTIFPPKLHRDNYKLQWKRQQAGAVFAAFVALLVPLATIVIATILFAVLVPWYSQQAKPPL